MLDWYALEDTLRLERQNRDREQARQARWQEQMPRSARAAKGSLRRYLAMLLLALADWLDPRTVVSVAHVPARPRLNGRPHQA